MAGGVAQFFGSKLGGCAVGELCSDSRECLETLDEHTNGCGGGCSERCSG